MAEPVNEARAATIEVVSESAAEARLWATLREVCELFEGLEWVLVGGLMVKILEAEHGRVMPVTTIDVDAIIDVRAMLRGQGTREAVRRLRAAGFIPFEPDRETVYRFIRGGDIVDVLAPDGLGDQADIVTEPPATTFRTPGGTRALRHRHTLLVTNGGDTFSVPVPDLGGALVIKARAAASATTSRTKHQRDLARLLVLVEHPYEMREALTATERRHLRRHRALVEPGHDAWSELPAVAATGAQALVIIID
jgi:hypothetical protein